MEDQGNLEQRNTGEARNGRPFFVSIRVTCLSIPAYSGDPCSLYEIMTVEKKVEKVEKQEEEEEEDEVENKDDDEEEDKEAQQ